MIVESAGEARYFAIKNMFEERMLSDRNKRVIPDLNLDDPRVRCA